MALRDKELQAIIQTYANNGALNKSILYYKARAQAKTVSSLQNITVEKIKQKTAVLWGEKDPVMLVEWSDRLGDFFEDFTLKNLPGIGHFVPFEAPIEVIDAVRSILFRNK